MDRAIPKLILFYRPRSEGDNVLGSVRPSVHPSVRVSEFPTSPAFNRLTIDLDIVHRGRP